MLKVKGCAALVLCGLLCKQANAQLPTTGQTGCPPSWTCPVTIGTIVTAAGPDLRDAVVQMRDGHLVLIRRIDRCLDVVSVLRTSADVLRAECFK